MDFGLTEEQRRVHMVIQLNILAVDGFAMPSNLELWKEPPTFICRLLPTSNLDTSQIGSRSSFLPNSYKLAYNMSEDYRK